MNLDQIKAGETCTIRLMFSEDNRWIINGRLRALGLEMGKEVKVLHNWWIFPIHLRVGMTELFIRRKDAKNIWVETLDELAQEEHQYP
jgi:ferrous iron transport protein A